MFALAIRIWRFLLTVEFGRIDEEEDDKSTKDSKEEEPVIPARKFRLGFAAEDADEDEEEEGEDVD